MPGKSAGFTLVELAIVLMIIGLLIGGILRGQELMETARVTSTIQQVKAYQGAVITFRDTYGGMPGDIPSATTRVPNCNPAVGCGNGDGNSQVGIAINVYAVGEQLNQAGITSAPAVETSYFWKHLALAHLISGVNPAADVSVADWGQTHPAGKIGGGFTVFFSPSVVADWGLGHILRMQITPYVVGTNEGEMVISPLKARMIDQKMDDGRPDHGDVTADFEGTNCDLGGVYQNTEEKNCVMYFNLM